MGVSLKCPECRTTLTIPDRFSGRSLVCPLCTTRLNVQATGDVYQVVRDDSPLASASRAGTKERSGTPTVVKVFIKNAPPSKEDRSWVAKHLLEVILGMIGTLVTTALLAYLGLSGSEKRDPKDDKLAPAK
jgi:uncharacterized protein YbaR (Trm112 family)